MSFLVLEDISKVFPTAVGVEKFDLSVERGEFISFLGPSGCGKTTTLRMVAGFESPTTGRIILNGEDITDRPPNQRNVGMVFQSYALFPNMTVAQNIGFGLKIRKEPESAIKQRVAEMLALIHLEQKGNSFPHQLSGGQQQRVAVARALATNPKLILADEPTANLDTENGEQVMEIMKKLNRETGTTFVFATHDPRVIKYANRVVTLQDGVIVKDAPGNGKS